MFTQIFLKIISQIYIWLVLNCVRGTFCLADVHLLICLNQPVDPHTSRSQLIISNYIISILHYIHIIRLLRVYYSVFLCQIAHMRQIRGTIKLFYFKYSL